MPDMDQLFKQQRQTEEDQTLPNAVYAIVAEDGAVGVEVQVTIPAHDPHQLFGPCRWAGTVVPAQGDAALVIFDDRGDPWIVALWPGG